MLVAKGGVIKVQLFQAAKPSKRSQVYKEHMLKCQSFQFLEASKRSQVNVTDGDS